RRIVVTCGGGGIQHVVRAPGGPVGGAIGPGQITGQRQDDLRQCCALSSQALYGPAPGGQGGAGATAQITAAGDQKAKKFTHWMSPIKVLRRSFARQSALN